MNQKDASVGSHYFNSISIWEEIELVLLRICKYLDRNKLAQNIKEIINKQKIIHKTTDNKSSSQEKFYEVFNLMSNVIKENKAEEINVFFVEFFRLSSLYFFSINESLKAFDILDSFIVKINDNIQGLEEEFHDKNLLIERDRMLINKAQMLFWEDRIRECNEIINNRISYLKEGLADEYYLIKMTFFYSTLLSYKAWIYFYDNDEVEADKSFYLSIKLIKDLKNIMKVNNLDLRDLHKRQIKLYDQYLNFLIFRDRKDMIDSELTNKNNFNNRSSVVGSIQQFVGQPNNYLLSKDLQDSTDLNLSAFKFLKEILKIINKETAHVGFFSEDLPESLLIYYNLLASYFCLSVVQNDTINIENAIYYMISTYIHSNRINIKISFKINSSLLKKILVLHSIVLKYGKSITIDKLDEDETSMISKSIKKLKQLIVLYEDDNNSNILSSDLYDNQIFNKIQELDFNKNEAELNVIKHSSDNKKNPINEQINEIFIIKYLCERFNYILACNILQDKKFALYKDSLVIEGLNGYLLVEENTITLIVQNTTKKESEVVFGMNMQNFSAKSNAPNLFIECLSLKSMDYYYIYYSKYVFHLSKEIRLDIFGYLVLVNFYTQMKLYKPAILILQNILTEMINHISLEELIDNYQGHYQLYVFFTFLLVEYYFKLDDFPIAFNLLLNIANKLNESSWLIYYMLLGVVLSKLQYMDLAAVYFEKVVLGFANVVLVEDKNNVNEDESSDSNNNYGMENKQINVIKKESVMSGFIAPIKMIISVTNMMKLKVLTDFIKKIDLDKENFLIDNEMNEQTRKKSRSAMENEYNDGILNYRNCFFCNKEVEVNDDFGLKMNCIKCRRAFYCSSECMKKDKYHHSKICELYFHNYSKVNDIIKNYILQQTE